MSGKAGEALLVYEYSQWYDRCDQDINPQVELQVVQEKWFMKVALGDVVLTGLKPVEISGQEDSFSLTTGLGLNYESLRFPVIELLSKLFDVCRQEPCLREEIVVFRKIVVHGDQVFCQQILSSQSIHARKMISSLIAFHFREEGRYCWSVDEPKVPIFIFINTGSEI